ncbi:hypothetical protein M422DRAFT_258588 [Sphaerobolus stellatus SS14]|uniref:Uncharacterized protein n=1 Tax=Sphaerobolus stellatus (strain SS14) TaxID=990650 RepID=A0A0C9VAX7_SPHS4|nr:hypothetical protein M422DRAFT_258588 [Sphaerobolus stellatus SS14]
MDFFDLKKEKWSSIITKSPGKEAWSYHVPKATEGPALNLAGNRLYIFGGGLKDQTGSNLLKELDLETKIWKSLSAEIVWADNSYPGQRRFATTWVDETQENLFVMFGDAELRNDDMEESPCGMILQNRKLGKVIAFGGNDQETESRSLTGPKRLLPT